MQSDIEQPQEETSSVDQDSDVFVNDAISDKFGIAFVIIVFLITNYVLLFVIL